MLSFRTSFPWKSKKAIFNINTVEASHAWKIQFVKKIMLLGSGISYRLNGKKHDENMCIHI